MGLVTFRVTSGSFLKRAQMCFCEWVAVSICAFLPRKAALCASEACREHQFATVSHILKQLFLGGCTILFCSEYLVSALTLQSMHYQGHHRFRSWPPLFPSFQQSLDASTQKPKLQHDAHECNTHLFIVRAAPRVKFGCRPPIHHHFRTLPQTMNPLCLL